MATEEKALPVRPAGDEEKQSKRPPPPPPLPEFIIERNKLFEELKKQYDEDLKNKPREEIKITLDLKNGEPPSVIIGKSWETTPGSLLKNVPKEFSSSIVISKLNDTELFDLDRPLEKDCKLSYVSFESTEGREVFWHSSAHVLGEACECQYNCLLSHGPPTAQGFFYDMAMPDG